eukprot:1161821-Pelagomonas_calceolata.AAC.10
MGLVHAQEMCQKVKVMCKSAPAMCQKVKVMCQSVPAMCQKVMYQNMQAMCQEVKVMCKSVPAMCQKAICRRATNTFMHTLGGGATSCQASTHGLY